MIKICIKLDHRCHGFIVRMMPVMLKGLAFDFLRKIYKFVDFLWYDEFHRMKKTVIYGPRATR